MEKIPKFLLNFIHISVRDLEITQKQLEQLSTLFLEIGLIFFASFVITPVVNRDYDLMTLGIFGPVLMWYICIKIIK